jgi:hypothetical protein
MLLGNVTLTLIHQHGSYLTICETGPNPTNCTAKVAMIVPQAEAGILKTVNNGTLFGLM